MNKIFGYSLLFALAVSATTVNAQYLNDYQGRPVLTKKYTDVIGEPYLNTDWKDAIVKLADNRTLSNVPLKYDLVEEKPVFTDNKGTVLDFVDEVREFKFEAGTEVFLFRNGYKPVDNRGSKQFYQVIYDGGIQLLKRVNASIMETRAYNSATSTKTITPQAQYFLVKDNQPVKIKKDKKAVLDFLSDKAPKLETYIKDNQLNLKNDSDLVKLLAYYSTI